MTLPRFSSKLRSPQRCSSPPDTHELGGSRRSVIGVPAHFLFLILSLFIAACGRPVSNVDTTETTLKALEQLSLEQTSGLGPHQTRTTTTITTTTGQRERVVRESSELKWDGWKKYAYQVKKADRTAFDVTVFGDKAFQRQLDGRLRVRNELEEFHYYLRQTWNPWPQIVSPFKPVIFLEAGTPAEVEGRKVTAFKLGLRPRIDAVPATEDASLQTVEHEQLEGAIWMDTTTGVPLKLTLKGTYKTVRLKRRGGAQGDETRTRVEFELLRTRIGESQVEGPPQVVARP